jgi:hypothetical protein
MANKSPKMIFNPFVINFDFTFYKTKKVQLVGLFVKQV